uniref:Uncharacterized protein n=1 Tax=Candidatus Kentrum sp. UNK TaxID=2126344 RepID=A0A451ATI1_9GAMM|nr:MAG: hypothetical protein BECKUNK1418G_GA0071005_13842 [Candidatus Kentron sp. UNK]VFK73917.1 MAG: hypothetical protein BECKUNK1418H_GA0071006_13672 [Candidatus Kentron sp. UNK]
MLLVRDESGEIEENWWNRYHWQEGIQECLPDDGWRFTLELEGQAMLIPKNTLPETRRGN